MTFTLADLTYRVAREMGGGILFEGTATGGTTSTLVDTSRTEASDYWNKGTAWIIRDAAGAGAAPEGEFSVISDWDLSTFTASLSTTLTTAIAAGDRYALCKKRYPLHVLTQMVNNALTELGNIPYEDETLQTSTDVTEYTLPAGVWAQNLLQVHLKDYYGNNVDKELLGWTVEFGATGVQDVLTFRGSLPTTYYLRLVYLKPHDELFNATDQLNEHVPIQRVVVPAALDAIKWYRDKTRLKDFDQKISELEDKKLRAEINYAIKFPRKPGVPLMGYRYG